MLDSDLKQQLQGYLGRITQPIELVAALDDSAAAGEMQALLADIAPLSNLVTYRELRGSDIPAGKRTPSFQVTRPGADLGIEFAGIPMGHEFTSLVLALLQAGGYPPKVDDAVIEQIKALKGDFNFEIFISLSCHNCPEVVQSLNLMAVLNPNVRTTHDRRRAVPAGSRKPPGHGRAVRVPERRRVQPGPHQPRGDPGQGRHRRRRARGRADQRQGPVRRAGRGRRPGGLVGRDLRGAQGHPHRRRRRPLRRPGAWTRSASRTSSRSRRPKARSSPPRSRSTSSTTTSTS